ncbi:hypothetical protein [Brachyspira hyodysenteriae]|uniref:hypothetical protein n=1 Tax=Brachyspira hyodysenteriae TaxID=159 RepID=UPI0022CD52C7|nr:hypothetical protein [Brachyspira hyodysenteriae]MCZ9981476.1 hypothetical protein [Brachyspira hyodysenteriae]MDA0080843.1 hypothetical protein [Brachyspira hyodysenteriae]
MAYCYSVDDYRENIKQYKDTFKQTLHSYMSTDFPEILFINIDNIYSLLKKSGIWNIYKKLISLADVGIDNIKIVKANEGISYGNFLNIKNKYKLTSIHKNYEDDFKKNRI